MTTIALQLTSLVRAAAEAAGYADAPVPLGTCVPTNDARHGDYQSNFAFRLGKSLRTNPREVAAVLVAALPPSEIVAGAAVAGPGFINFRLSDAFLAADVVRRAGHPSLGAPPEGEGRTVVVDYSSPNIAKRMHMGHMRSTIIGNAIDRMYRFLGWNVVADNHLGDWGTQFGKLIVGWHGWRDAEAYDRDPIGELQRIYVEFGRRAAEDPALEDRARAQTAKLQAGDPDNLALWQAFTRQSMREFDHVYARMGVRFDVSLGESFYREGLQALIDRLLADGIAVEDQGAAMVPFTDEDGKGLADNPLLIRKSDGAALYGTTDIATLYHRVASWQPERMVYVTDVRQRLHFRQLFATASKLGIDADLVHVWFGMMRYPDGTIMATRTMDDGTERSVNLVDVMDSAVAKARAVVDDKSAHLADSERAAIAEAVGVGALKYADLAQNPQTDIVFDEDSMLSLEGNTAPYMMYAHARVKSIFRKAEIDEFTPGDVVLGEPVERELALAIARTPEVVQAAASSHRPNLLCDHLFALANTFARFYHDCRVLDDDPAVRRSRLSLSHAAASALSIGLGLLGISALDRM